MITYSIYEAKAKFSEVIRRVKNGESITVTERGKPTAVITQVPQKETHNERWQRLIAEGVIITAKQKFSAKKFKGHNIPGALERFLKERHRNL